MLFAARARLRLPRVPSCSAPGCVRTTSRVTLALHYHSSAIGDHGQKHVGLGAAPRGGQSEDPYMAFRNQQSRRMRDMYEISVAKKELGTMPLIRRKSPATSPQGEALLVDHHEEEEAPAEDVGEVLLTV